MTFLKNSVLLLFLILMLPSCTEIETFDPDFHVFGEVGLVNEHGTIVPYAEAVDSFACLHKEKIIELKKILSKGSKKKSLNSKMDREVAKVLWLIQSN